MRALLFVLCCMSFGPAAQALGRRQVPTHLLRGALRDVARLSGSEVLPRPHRQNRVFDSEAYADVTHYAEYGNPEAAHAARVIAWQRGPRTPDLALAQEAEEAAQALRSAGHALTFAVGRLPRFLVEGAHSPYSLSRAALADHARHAPYALELGMLARAIADQAKASAGLKGMHYFALPDAKSLFDSQAAVAEAAARNYRAERPASPPGS